VLLRPVVWWLGTNVSEAALPPSSGLRFVMKEMYQMHCCNANLELRPYILGACSSEEFAVLIG